MPSRHPRGPYPGCWSAGSGWCASTHEVRTVHSRVILFYPTLKLARPNPLRCPNPDRPSPHPSPPPPTNRPSAVAICSAIFAIVCAAGFVRVETKNKVTELWVPQDTPIMRSRQHVEASFGAPPSWMAIIVRKVGSETAALSPETVELMYDLEALIDQLPMRHEVCLHSSADPAPGGRCVHRGVTNLWCNRTQYEAEVGSKPDPAVALVDVVNLALSAASGCPSRSTESLARRRTTTDETFRSAVPGVSRSSAPSTRRRGFCWTSPRRGRAW